jgi:hypothetical protein
MASSISLLLLQLVLGPAAASNSVSSVGGSVTGTGSGGAALASSTTAAIVNLGYPPAPPNHPGPASLSGAASADHVARVAAVTNEILQGKLNVTSSVTLTINVASTTITDHRISPTNAVILLPATANAAAEMAAGTVYVSSQTSGSAVITHANNATADRAYRVVILG